MDKKSVLTALDRFREALEARGIRVEKLILFGSYATGKQREGSDIDVVVISWDFEGKGYWERVKILSDAIYTVFEPIEAVALTPEEWDSGTTPVSEYARDGECIID